MDTILRGLTVYLFVWAILRVAGKRTLSESTVFDFVLLLIIAETTQNALVGEDTSLTGAFLLLVTLISTDIGVSLLKLRFPKLDRFVDGQPLVLVDQGRILEEQMRKSRVTEADLLEAARQQQGLERLEQIEYAILEQSGGISIIPRGRAQSSGGTGQEIRL